MSEIERIMEQYDATLELMHEQQSFNEKLLASYEQSQAQLRLAKETLQWFADESNYESRMRVEEGGKMIDYISEIEKEGVNRANEALVRVG